MLPDVLPMYLDSIGNDSDSLADAVTERLEWLDYSYLRNVFRRNQPISSCVDEQLVLRELEACLPIS